MPTTPPTVLLTGASGFLGIHTVSRLRAAGHPVRALVRDRSKLEAQAPVTIVNPGGVVGPDDPYVGENAESCIAILKNRLPAWPRGQLHYVDVRDTAEVLTAAVTHEPGGRYLIPGATVPSP